MSTSEIDHLDAAIEHATWADSSSVVDDVSKHYLRIEAGRGDTVVIRGNKEGLIYLGLSILRLARKDVGAHLHFDEANLVDECDRPLVIAKCFAEWEE